MAFFSAYVNLTCSKITNVSHTAYLTFLFQKTKSNLSSCLFERGSKFWKLIVTCQKIRDMLEFFVLSDKLS